ncbi:unnamed protein product [Allacma fusca]|uniref:Kelch-like protein diablo n=1 Tax=Allacma fusca TaxID=39272 RepID=A0A8J2LQV2_9HEXA|nr:unnamed protein product [Allacma fusca]
MFAAQESCIPSTSNSSSKKPGKLNRNKRRRGICVEKCIGLDYPQIWTDYRNNNTLCDGKLRASDGEELPVHVALVCAGSSKLKKLFLTASRRGQGNSLVLPDVTSDALKTFIDFVYTGECKITQENVRQILPFAENFNVPFLLQQCAAFLIKEINTENCIKIFKMAKIYFCPELVNKARLYLLCNFKEIVETPEFCELGFEELEDILRDDLLNIRSEEMVFIAVRKWVEKNPEERASRVIELLQTIRFGLMSYRFFTTVVLQWQFVANNIAAQNALYEASIFLAQMDSRNGTEVDLNDPLARPRVPHEIVFCIGGWSAGSPTSFVETYDSRADRWFITNSADVNPRAYHGLVSLGSLIYMIGGFDGHDHFNTVRCYDTTTRLWTEKACMYYPRCYVSCCLLDGFIYALGGYNGRLRMASVEKYHPKENQWELVAPMNRQRSDASACSLNGKLYVAGGFNGQEVLNSVEIYNPAENQWTFIHAMRSARSGVSLVPYHGCLYAIGGFNGFTRLNTAEKYDPQNPGEWTSIADMSSPRSNFASVVVDDMIFVIGGFNGTTTIPYVECYDGDNNEWFDAAHMNLNRSALNACVMRGLINGQESVETLQIKLKQSWRNKRLP